MLAITALSRIHLRIAFILNLLRIGSNNGILRLVAINLATERCQKTSLEK